MSVPEMGTLKADAAALEEVLAEFFLWHKSRAEGFNLRRSLHAWDSNSREYRPAGLRIEVGA